MRVRSIIRLVAILAGCAAALPVMAQPSQPTTQNQNRSDDRQAPRVNRTMRPVLDSLAMVNHTITRLDELEFILDRSIKQAVATRAPCAFILSPLLTGGKVFKA